MAVKWKEMRWVMQCGGYIDKLNNAVYIETDNANEVGSLLVRGVAATMPEGCMRVPYMSKLSAAVDYVYGGNVSDEQWQRLSAYMDIIFCEYPLFRYVDHEKQYAQNKQLDRNEYVDYGYAYACERMEWSTRECEFMREFGNILFDGEYDCHKFRDFCYARLERIGVKWCAEHGIDIEM